MESIINSIRDILRKEGVTGMDSINHCIVFIISRMLNKKLCKKFDIDKKFIFKNIAKDDNGEELGNQDLYNRIYNGTKECLIGQIIFKLGFRNIKFKLEGTHNLRLIYDKLKDFDTDSLSTEYDLIGTIYELHLKSGTSNAMRDLGQYYTHRLVIQYMIELCDPQMKNGMIEKIVDPTMGTGGFLTMSIKYLNNKYKNKIDWQKNKDNIIGFDIDDNVKNMALLNIFLEIGELCTDTIIKQDTLHNDMKFTDDGTILEKADVILANEPMGLKNIIHATLCDRIKNMKIRGTKAEPLFLQLFMESLNDNGRCAVIVPDGVLFNESNLHNGTRKHLIENFNLQKVVSLNDDFFLNTGVRTSILFFNKDGNKTKKVDFCEIKLKNGKIEENSFIKVEYDKIKEANYSLFVNKYNTTEIEKIEGIEYKKLGEICEFIGGKRKKLSDATENGQYNFYTCSIQNHLKINKPDFVDEGLIMNAINGSGKCNIYWDANYSLTSNNIHFKPKIQNAKTQYIYYYLKTNLHLLENGFVGSNQQKIAVEYIKTIEIPIPSLSIQEAIVERLDVLNKNIEKSKQMVDEYWKIIKYYVDCQTKNENKIKFGEMCKTESGDYIKSSDFIEGKYPIYGGGNASKFINKKNRSDTFVIAKDGVSEKCVRYINGDFFLNHHGWTLKFKDKKLQIKKYVYYWLLTHEHKLFNLAKGSAQKGINRESFYSIEINMPTKEKQKKIVEYCDNLSDMINRIEQQMKDNKNLMKHILDSYLGKREKKQHNINQ